MCLALTVIFCSVANDKGPARLASPPVFSKLFLMSLAKLVPDSHVTTSKILLSYYTQYINAADFFFFFHF